MTDFVHPNPFFAALAAWDVMMPIDHSARQHIAPTKAAGPQGFSNVVHEEAAHGRREVLVSPALGGPL